MFVDPNGLDNYIYYGKDQKEAAKLYKKDLENKYRNIPTHMIYVDNPETFYTNWNNMGNESGDEVSIDNVIINLHGNQYGIYSSDDKEINISKLDIKKINILLLLSCDTSNIDYSDTISEQIASSQQINLLVAPDGTNTRSINDDNTNVEVYSHYDNKQRKKGCGYIIYYKDNNNLHRQFGIFKENKRYNILKMLDKTFNYSNKFLQ